jgi:hypothetical protein
MWMIVSQHANQIGRNVQRAKLSAREPSWPSFVRLQWNEVMELLSQTRLAVEIVPQPVREYAVECIHLIDTLSNQGRDALTTSLLWEGGFNLPKTWLFSQELEDAWLSRLPRAPFDSVATWKCNMEATRFDRKEGLLIKDVLQGARILFPMAERQRFDISQKIRRSIIAID